MSGMSLQRPSYCHRTTQTQGNSILAVAYTTCSLSCENREFLLRLTLVAYPGKVIPVGMSHVDWMRWCNQSQGTDLNSHLSLLDAVSFTAVAVYAAAFVIGVFLMLLWFKKGASKTRELWKGFNM